MVLLFSEELKYIKGIENELKIEPKHNSDANDFHIYQLIGNNKNYIYTNDQRIYPNAVYNRSLKPDLFDEMISLLELEKKI